MNDIYDWVMFFLFAICIIITGVSVYKWTDWKRESNENLSLFLKEKAAFEAVNAELEEKNKQLEEAKSWERVIKIEQVHLQPRELECKFPEGLRITPTTHPPNQTRLRKGTRTSEP